MMKLRGLSLLLALLGALPLARASYDPPFTTPLEATSTTPRGAAFSNPVIPGFTPDPSIARKGDDFYLVSSSFEYFPGVPIYHSRDLVNWELINYCLTRPEQLPLEDCQSSSGIYAPVIRYHDGLFYMITTNFASGGVFYVTAEDPRGEWSDPVWLGNRNVDPSLFFDDDGKVYLVHPDGGERGQVFLMEMDMERGAYKEGQELPGKFIWMGTGGKWPEAPHIYKIGSRYYLSMAEGGTEVGHRQTVARSDSVWGPYWPYEDNPILTHRDLPEHPIRAVGHADFVQLSDGSWWGVSLGVRQSKGKSNLGRETFLAPIEWTADGWPVFNGNRRMPLELAGPNLPRQEIEAKPARDEFEAQDLDLEWNYIRNPHLENYSLGERPGWLRLKGTEATLNDRASPTALLLRQRHFDVEFGTRLDFKPGRPGDEAGLVLRLNEALRVEFCIAGEADGARLVLRQMDLDTTRVLFSAPAPAGPVELLVVADRDRFVFRFRDESGAVTPAGQVSTAALSPETSWERGVMCFLGLMIGIYASGNGEPASTPADFDWFEYQPY